MRWGCQGDGSRPLKKWGQNTEGRFFCVENLTQAP